ncbi:hypothetical protein AOQ84DRAFT_360834, partial [Glonium stellatum]
MAEASSASSSESLSTIFADCLMSYQKLLLALNIDDCRIVQLEQVDVARIHDELGRTKIWGDQTKATLPPRARGSLDDTLRNNPDIQGTVRGILNRLRWCLDQAIPIAERKYGDSTGSDHDSIASMSVDSDSGAEDEADCERPRISKIAWLMQQAFEQIKSLFHLSSLLRRPSFTGKYIRSTDKKAKVDPEKQESDLTFCLNQFDREHVFEKVRQWNCITKSAENIPYEDEEPAPPDEMKCRTDIDIECSEDLTVLCQRIAGANTRRREQLQYWTHHPDNLSALDSASTLLTTGIPTKEIPVPGQKRGDGSHSQVSATKPSNQKNSKQNDEAKSSLSKQSFSTVAKSAIFETKTNSGRPRTVYAQSTAVKGGQNRVPNTPITAKSRLYFHCPYCGMELISRQMEDRQAWKRHVFRDLRPYICTFLECQTPEKLYVTRHDWIYHEMQMHRRQFVCGDCDEKHPTRDLMETHLKAHHGELFSESQLPIVLDMCDRPADDSEQSLCVLCGEEMSLSKLQVHLATHMEDIALFVLPSNVDDEEADGGSKMSNQAAKLKSEPKNDDDETSSLDSVRFSNSGSELDHEQTPADFQQLLTTTQLEVNSKIALWEKQDSSGEDNHIMATRRLLKTSNDSDVVNTIAFSPD